jgi:hypothetical protein
MVPLPVRRFSVRSRESTRPRVCASSWGCPIVNMRRVATGASSKMTDTDVRQQTQPSFIYCFVK